MKRVLFFIYGVVSYALGVGTLVYLILFLGDLIVPITIDGAVQAPLWQAVITNVGLILLFALQHSVMARPKFKASWTKIVPEPIERSTYVLFTFIALSSLMYFWEPMGGEIWKISDSSPFFILIYGMFFLGWTILLLATFLINHFDLFGLRQVYLNLIKKPYTPLVFKERAFYKSIRHPIYSGIMMGMWFTPHMTVSHFFLAGLWTAYIFYAIGLEEKDLLNAWGDKYRAYMGRTGKIFPKISKKDITTESIHEQSNA
ncbi:MAG: hypothetical protein JXR07_15440 [Reichenbachiella sp.]